MSKYHNIFVIYSKDYLKSSYLFVM
ncbi:hypothetical protein [Brevibacillus sp. MS2.2]